MVTVQSSFTEKYKIDAWIYFLRGVSQRSFSRNLEANHRIDFTAWPWSMIIESQLTKLGMHSLHRSNTNNLHELHCKLSVIFCWSTIRLGVQSGSGTEYLELLNRNQWQLVKLVVNGFSLTPSVVCCTEINEYVALSLSLVFVPSLPKVWTQLLKIRWNTAAYFGLGKCTISSPKDALKSEAYITARWRCLRTLWLDIHRCSGLTKYFRSWQTLSSKATTPVDMIVNIIWLNRKAALVYTGSDQRPANQWLRIRTFRAAPLHDDVLSKNEITNTGSEVNAVSLISHIHQSVWSKTAF